ncbi:cell wall-binding repeat-containing protein [Salinibacterium hongtaonis]|uniref:cell wall-binding repeat-containing protein n=1 Tax=Homoserinimonas hongtaonis TaxID=2079791 RepID=UPI000D36CF77|nr:cell wall-binding repeat-containing protein [Salinibacterium hongtaonis]AWB88632.1 hypothetical protein C2138_02885 [Salinibacterium hongtaonis]
MRILGRALLLLFLSGLMLAAGAGVTSASPGVPGDGLGNGTTRISGADRYATAIAISQNYAPGVPVVYVATGSNYPDALSAAPAAASQGGPLLLTLPDALPSSVRMELQRLSPQQIVVVGGPSAVGDAVYGQLEGLSSSVRRDSGVDRYSTSRIVTERAFGVSGSSRVFIATGENFPDALSASAAAGASSSGVILVQGAAGSVDLATRGLLVTLRATAVSIAGGSAVVSDGIENSLRQLPAVTDVARLSGVDRYSTSLAINRASFPSASRAFLAVGTGFADALAGAALAGAGGAPLYIIPGHCVPDSVLAEFSRMGVGSVVLLGGDQALAPAIGERLPCSQYIPPAPPAPILPPLSGNPGDSKNCSDFRTWAEAQAWFDRYFPLYGDVAKLDSDGDGIACETLK